MEEKGDGKKDLGGCRPRDDLHATWRVVASKMSGGCFLFRHFPKAILSYLQFNTRDITKRDFI